MKAERGSELDNRTMKTETLRACHCCGKVHSVPVILKKRMGCTRCGTIYRIPIERRVVAERTMATAIGALVLYFPAILLPILTVEQLGQRHQTSLLSGGIELLSHGNLFVGLIVLLFSIVFPLVKIIGLLELSWFGLLKRPHQAAIFRAMDQMKAGVGTVVYSPVIAARQKSGLSQSAIR